MKKAKFKFLALLPAIVGILTLTGCLKEEENLFDKSAAERMTAAVETYTQRFAASKGGWAMEYYPTNGLSAPKGKGYLILANIKDDGSVTMAMNNEMTNYQYLEDTSLWEIIKDMGPVLSFSTYNNCIHFFCDPGFYDTGLGFEGDYEFVVIDLPEDAEMAMVKGKKSGVYVRMTSLDEGTVYKDYLESVNNFQNKYFTASAPNKLYMNLHGEEKYVEDMSTMIPNIYPLLGDPISDESYHPCMLTIRDNQYYLRFKGTLDVDDEIGYVQEFVWNETDQKFEGVENPDCYLAGENPQKFFNRLIQGTSTFQWTETSVMSDSVKTYVTNIAEKFNSMKNYKFTNIQLKVTKGVMQMNVNYTYNRRATTAYYNFTYTIADDGTLTLNYAGPADKGATNILNSIPAIGQMANALNGVIKVTDAGNPFNLTDMKLTNGGNEKYWLVVTKK